VTAPRHHPGPVRDGDPDRGPPATIDGALAPIPRPWYARPVLEVARDLLGARVVRDDDLGRRVGRIVEVEAYDGPDDRASHARVGPTARTAPMFGEPGHAYVYLVYGMHHCLNVVAHPVGRASAVLIRAVEPQDGPGAASGARTAAGPGLVGRWLDIDRTCSGLDLTIGRSIWLAHGARLDDADVLTGPRIGVGYAGPDWATLPWRFGVRGSPALSRPFPGPA
jgi:DNA-3-methyladenine glycosylase